MGIMSGILGNAGVVDSEKLLEKYGQLLADGETMQIGFNVFRDIFAFTDKRLILIDVQGITGKKMEYMSIPHNKITKFSIETAGHFDLDAELKIWIGSIPTPIQKRFNKKVNIYDVHKILSNHVMA